MGCDGSILGSTCDFQYSIKLSKQEDSTEPVSGLYSGYFVVKTDIQKRVYERNLSLNFVKDGDVYNVSGKGTNEFGDFLLFGVYSPSSKDLTCTKE